MYEHGSRMAGIADFDFARFRVENHQDQADKHTVACGSAQRCVEAADYIAGAAAAGQLRMNIAQDTGYQHGR